MDKTEEVMEKIKSSEFDYVAEGEMCECGSRMVEGECNECGKMSGDMMEKLYGKQKRIDKNKNRKIDKQDFRMLRGEMDEEDCMECGDMKEGEMCECSMSESYKGMCVECGMPKSEMLEYGTGNSDFTAGMNEEMTYKDQMEQPGYNSFMEDFCSTGQNYLSQECIDYYDYYSGKLDSSSEDEKEFGEGNAFTGMLKKTKKGSEFELNGKKYRDNSNLDETLYRLVNGNESALFTENEIIDIIENIIKEEKEKDNIKKGVQHKGLSTYEKAYKGSGKENKEYLDSVAKKMTDYIKDGSKGKYETNPKNFPRGNGQLAKMDKKAYEIDDEGTDFNMQIGGQLIPDYDNGSHPDKKTIEKQIKGSATNGNDPKWANADDTGVNNKFAEYFEEDQLGKWKDESYGRVPSPVYKGKGDNKLKLAKGKSKGKSKDKLKEEFERIQEIIGYTQKTQ
jgi:hypothetical protein